jgi:hypothetical protein
MTPDAAFVLGFVLGAQWQEYRRVPPLLDWPPGEAARKEAEARIGAGVLQEIAREETR